MAALLSLTTINLSPSTCTPSPTSRSTPLSTSRAVTMTTSPRSTPGAAPIQEDPGTSTGPPKNAGPSVSPYSKNLAPSAGAAVAASITPLRPVKSQAFTSDPSGN